MGISLTFVLVSFVILFFSPQLIFADSEKEYLFALKSVKKISSESSDFAVVEFRVINYLNEDLDFSKKNFVHLKNSNGDFFGSTITNQLKENFGIDCSDSGKLVTRGLTKEISLCFEVPKDDQEDYLLVIDKDKTLLSIPHEIHLYLNSHNITTEFSIVDINSVFFTIHDVRTKSISGYDLLIVEFTAYNGYAPINKYGKVTPITVLLEGKKFFVTDSEDNNYSALSTQFPNTGYEEFCPKTYDLHSNEFDDFVYCFDIPKSTKIDTEYWLVLNDAPKRYRCGIDCQEKMWSLSPFMSSSITEGQKTPDPFEREQHSSIPAESPKLQNLSPKSAIVEWVERISSGSDNGNFDLDQIQIEINEIQLSNTPKLILIDFTLENHNNKQVHLRGSEILNLRTFDPIKFESDPKRQAPNFDNSYQYLIPEKIESGFSNVEFSNKCERLDNIINPGDSGRAVICFNPNYETSLPDINTTEFYLVLSNRPENSCPVCNLTFLNDKISEKIPNWVKNNANWWSSNQISDQEFAKGLEYLIRENLIKVPQETLSEQQTETQIPNWLKKSAGWWSQNSISDNEFLTSIQWLVENGFIKI